MIFLFYDYVFFIQQLIAFGQICQSDTHAGSKPKIFKYNQLLSHFHK